MSSTSRLIERRRFLAGLAAALGTLTAHPSLLAASSDTAAETFSRNVVLDLARSIAEHPFIPPATLPAKLKNLNYDRYRQIRFDKKAALWAGSRTRFSVEMFAPGYIYDGLDNVYIVDKGVAKSIQLEKDTFITPGSEVAEALVQLNKISGFRVHFPINTPKYQDEFLVFQGASYFRAVSRTQSYGLSARGLAIDVGEPTGEEFPIFRQFWIERPANKSDSIVIHALLDSKRVTGAYQFVVFPGNTTTMEIKATLFPRTKLNHVGLGPLTSMFLFGDIDRSEFPDYRNAVHDSNGLAILNGMGEQIWRPLSNPKAIQFSYFIDSNPKGFGLVQRTREQRDFEDLQANYHTRPSTWVEPIGNWGEGSVVLVEIPTTLETNDNIVAYWLPKKPVEPGTPFDFAYKLSWPDDNPLPKGFGRIRRTTYGFKWNTQLPQYAIDYSDLPTGVNLGDIRFNASVSKGRVLETQAVPNGLNGMRLFVTFDPEGASLTELRVHPLYMGQTVGEIMLFRWLSQQ